MAISGSFVQQGMNVIQAGLFRGPAVLGSLMGAAYIGELAMRGLTVAGAAIGLNVSEPAVGSYRATITDTIRPHRHLPTKDVLIRGLALAVLGAIGFHLAGWAFGPAPTIYNECLSWLGPVRISNDVHPLIAAMISYVRPA